MLYWRKNKPTNRPPSNHLAALIVAIALLRKLIYLLANKISLAPSTLPPNPKSVAGVPGDQCLKVLKRVFADPLVLLGFAGVGKDYAKIVRTVQQESYCVLLQRLF